MRISALRKLVRKFHAPNSWSMKEHFVALKSRSIGTSNPSAAPTRVGESVWPRASGGGGRVYHASDIVFTHEGREYRQYAYKPDHTVIDQLDFVSLKYSSGPLVVNERSAP